MHDSRLLIPALFSALLLSGCTEPETLPEEQERPVSLQSALGGNAEEGFLRAVNPREFSFPEDHALHAGYRNEWWYFTGNLFSESGRHFGYQLTLFSVALRPSADEHEQQAENSSAWQSQRIWMGHLALTDTAGGTHHVSERFSRENPGLAGVREKPFRVWLEDWQVSGSDSTDSFPWQLQAQTGELGINLSLSPAKNPVLQGEQGLSRKSAEAGNASYYYSMTRLDSAGVLSLADERFSVTGQSWLDREWSTSVLADEQSGWNWFSLQFADGTELMYYELLDTAGQPHAFSAGNFTDREGVQHSIRPEDISLTATDNWRSPEGTEYQTGWLLNYRGQQWRVQAVLEDQWMDLLIPYWEGAVQITDDSTGEPAGYGYLEMVH